MRTLPSSSTLGLVLLLWACGPGTPEPHTPGAAVPDRKVEAEPDPSPAQPRSPTGPPADDALACAPFPFAPDDGVRRCAASEVVGGVAVEKAWVLVPGRRKGRPMTPDDPDRWWISWTLLVQTPTGWARAALYDITCGGEVPAGCSHDEMFRRSFEVVRDASRVAVVASGADGRDPIGAFAMLVDEAPPFIFPASKPPASAKALLDVGPANLEAAYRQQLASSRAIKHALTAADVGVSGPRDLLGGLLASEADWNCSPLLEALRTHPGDRWVEEQLSRPNCGQNLASPTGPRELDLPQECVRALARCGLMVDAPLTVSNYERSDQTNAVVPGDQPLFLGPHFDLFGQVVADPPIFVANSSCAADAALRSRTAVVWLGSGPVTCDTVVAPVVIVPDTSNTAAPPAGACRIPAQVCPAP